MLVRIATALLLGLIATSPARAGEGLKINPPPGLSAVPAPTFAMKRILRTWVTPGEKVRESVLFSRLPKAGPIQGIDQMGELATQKLAPYCGSMTAGPADAATILGYPSLDVTFDCRPAILPNTGENVAARNVRRYVFVVREADFYWLQMDVYLPTETAEPAADIARRWDALVASLARCDDLIEIEACL